MYERFSNLLFSQTQLRADPITGETTFLQNLPQPSVNRDFLWHKKALICHDLLAIRKPAPIYTSLFTKPDQFRFYCPYSASAT